MNERNQDCPQLPVRGEATEVSYSRPTALPIQWGIKFVPEHEVKRLRCWSARILESLKDACQQEKAYQVSHNSCCQYGYFAQIGCCRAL